MGVPLNTCSTNGNTFVYPDKSQCPPLRIAIPMRDSTPSHLYTNLAAGNTTMAVPFEFVYGSPVPWSITR